MKHPCKFLIVAFKKLPMLLYQNQALMKAPFCKPLSPLPAYLIFESISLVVIISITILNTFSKAKIVIKIPFAAAAPKIFHTLKASGNWSVRNVQLLLVSWL